jgi:hypothetical protein
MTPEAIKALAKAQAAMAPVRKNAVNPHLKNRYADLESCLDAITPSLNANGFVLLQPSGADERGAYVETVFAHESGGAFHSRVYLVIDKQTMQGLGSAITYARRYGLLGLAGLAPEDDDGNAASRPAPRREERADPPFNAEGAGERIAAGIAKAANVDGLAEFWKGEQDTLKAIRAADPAILDGLVKAMQDRKETLINDYKDVA